MDSIEAQGVKAFRYSYPFTKYSVKAESSEDEEFKVVGPVFRTVSTDNSNEDDDDSSSFVHLGYPVAPTVEAVGFKPLFTGYKPTTTAVVTNQAVSVGTPIAQEYSVGTPIVNHAVSVGTPIAQEYSVATTKAADTTVAAADTTVAASGIVSNAFVKPLLYTVPASTVSHISVPTTQFVAGSNQFYTAGSGFTYPTTFYTSRPFFYTQRIAPFTTVSNNVVQAFPHVAYDSVELDD